MSEEYLGLGVFMLQYFLLVNVCIIVHYNCIIMNEVGQ